MGFRDYSRLFGISDEQLKRKQMPFGSQGAPDMFAGSGQHERGVASAAQQPGIAESVLNAGVTLGSAALGAQADSGEGFLGIASKSPDLGMGVGLPGPPDMGGSGSAPQDFGGGGAGGSWGPPPVTARPGWDDGPTETSYSGINVISPPETDSQFIKMTDPIRGGRRAIHGFGGYRRYGGPVDPLKKYIIGENGPEMFVPDVPGTVVPNPIDDPARPPWNRVSPAVTTPVRTVSAEAPDPMMEPSPYDGKTRGRMADNATPRERALGEITDLQRAGPQRESKMWKRVGQGILGGLSEWVAAGSPGGIAGAIGAVGAGATLYGASKGAAAEGQHRQKLAGLFGKYKEAVAPELAEMERMKAGAEAQGKIYDTRKKGWEALQTEHKPFYDSIVADKRVTPDEVAEAARRGIKLTPYDAQRYGIEWVGGKAYATPELGDPTAIRNRTLPDKPNEYTAPVTVDDGRGGKITGHLTGPQAIKAATDLAETQSRVSAQQEERMYQRKKDMTDQQWKEYTFGVEQEGKKADRALREAAAANRTGAGGAAGNGLNMEALGAMQGSKARLDLLNVELNTAGKEEEDYEKIRLEIGKELANFWAAEGKFKQGKKGGVRVDPLELLQY